MTIVTIESGFEILLEVQATDLVIDQLHHKRDSIPERAERDKHLQAIAATEQERKPVDETLHDLERTQRRQEDEVASVVTKITDIDKSLYSGTVSSPRDLQAMQAEIEALKRRQNALEEELLATMEQVEPVAMAKAQLDETKGSHLTEVERLNSLIEAKEAVIDGELAEVVAKRSSLAISVEPGILATYEKLRAHLGGVGVARLDGGRCTGCHLTLPAAELDALRHAGEGIPIFHEECGRLLVR